MIYKGDEKIGLTDGLVRKHSKRNVEWQHQCKSARLTLKDHSLQSDKLPVQIYEENLLTAKPAQLATGLQQVQNICKISRRDRRLSHDAIFALMELSIDLGHFVKEFTITPDQMTMICYREGICV